MKKCKVVVINVGKTTEKKVLNVGPECYGVFELPDVEEIIDEYLAKGYEVKAWDYYEPKNIRFYLEKNV